LSRSTEAKIEELLAANAPHIAISANDLIAELDWSRRPERAGDALERARVADLRRDRVGRGPACSTGDQDRDVLGRPRRSAAMNPPTRAPSNADTTSGSTHRDAGAAPASVLVPGSSGKTLKAGPSAALVEALSKSAHHRTMSYQPGSTLGTRNLKVSQPRLVSPNVPARRKPEAGSPGSAYSLARRTIDAFGCGQSAAIGTPASGPLGCGPSSTKTPGGPDRRLRCGG
jgi:hypothetical protein